MINLEKMVDGLFKDINHIRSSPVSYAHNLAKKESLYMGDIYRPKGKYIQTKQGVNALRDAAVQLQRTPPLPPLIWSFALHVLADEQAIYIGTNGLNKGDRNLSQRAPRYAVVSGRVNQLIELGGATSEEVLHELIVDDGLATRKRRKTLLDQKYRHAGIASAKHNIYGYCTVIIFAQQIHELLKPTKELVQLEVQKGLNKDIQPGQNYYKIKKPPLLNQIKHFKKSQVIIPPPVMIQSIPTQIVPQHFHQNPVQTIQTSEIYDTTIVQVPPAIMTSSYHLPQMGLPPMSAVHPNQNVQIHLERQSSMQPGLIVTGPQDQQFIQGNQYRGTMITAPQHVMMVNRLSQYRPPQLPEEQPAPGILQRCTSSCLLF